MGPSTVWRCAALLVMVLGSETVVTAEDGRWVMLAENDRVVTLLDAASVERVSPTVRSSRIRRIFKGNDPDTAYAIDEVDLDCSGKRFRYRSTVIFDRDGDVFRRYRVNDQMRPVPEDSSLAAAWKLVCRGKSDPGEPGK